MSGIIKKSGYLRYLLTPWAISISSLCATIVGYYDRPLALAMTPIGNIFLALLEVCVIPLILCGIPVSFANLVKHHNAKNLFTRLIFTAGVSVAITCLYSFFIAYSTHAIYTPDSHTRKVLSDLIVVDNLSDNVKVPIHTDFLSSMFSSNIFHALSQNHILAVVIFSILFGISLGCANSKNSETALACLDGVFDALLKFVNGICYILPFGLFAILSHQIAITGFSIMLSMWRWIGIFWGSGIMYCLIMLMIASRFTRIKFDTLLTSLRQTFLVALITTSSFATLPVALTALEKQLKRDKEIINLTLPIGVCIHPVGAILLHAFCVFFMLALYGKSLLLSQLPLMFFGIIFCALASSGVPAIAIFSLLSIILTPLGLPTETAVILFISIAHLIDPVATLMNVTGNCVLSLFMTEQAPTPTESSLTLQTPFAGLDSPP